MTDRRVMRSKTDWPIFTTSLVTLLAIAGPLMVWPEAGGRLVAEHGLPALARALLNSNEFLWLP